MHRFILTLFVSFFLAGCATPFAIAPRPVEKVKESRIQQSELVEPVFIGADQAGKPVIAYRRSFDYAAGASETRPKGSLWGRIVGWFLGLGVIGGALAFFFPTAFFAFVLWAMNKYRKLKIAYIQHQQALKETIAGITYAGAVERDAKLHDTLKDEQSPQTKKIVGALRAEL